MTWDTRRFLLVLLFCVGTVCFSGVALAQSPVPRPPTGESPLFWLTGADSKIVQPEYRLIKDKEDWHDLWQRHTDTVGSESSSVSPVMAPAAGVDFSKSMVVAVLAGKKQQCSGLWLYPIAQTKEEIVLRYQLAYYSVAVSLDDPSALDKFNANPYGFFVLPRSDKRVVIEEAVYGKWSLQENDKFEKRAQF